MSRQELFDFQKSQVDGAARFGRSAREIHKLFSYAHGTIPRKVTNIKTIDSAETKEQNGHP